MNDDLCCYPFNVFFFFEIGKTYPAAFLVLTIIGEIVAGPSWLVKILNQLHVSHSQNNEWNHDKCDCGEPMVDKAIQCIASKICRFECESFMILSASQVEWCLVSRCQFQVIRQFGTNFPLKWGWGGWYKAKNAHYGTNWCRSGWTEWSLFWRQNIPLETQRKCLHILYGFRTQIQYIYFWRKEVWKYFD